MNVEYLHWCCVQPQLNLLHDRGMPEALFDPASHAMSSFSNTPYSKHRDICLASSGLRFTRWPEENWKLYCAGGPQSLSCRSITQCWAQHNIRLNHRIHLYAPVSLWNNTGAWAVSQQHEQGRWFLHKQVMESSHSYHVRLMNKACTSIWLNLSSVLSFPVDLNKSLSLSTINHTSDLSLLLFPLIPSLLHEPTHNPHLPNSILKTDAAGYYTVHTPEENPF